MDAGQQYFRGGDDTLDLVVVAGIHHVVTAEHAVAQGLLSAEPEHAGGRFFPKTCRTGVVAIHDEHVVLRLISKDAALGVHVVVKVRVLVEVVGRDVGDDGDVRAYVDAVQLEARQFEDGYVLGTKVGYLGQQRLAYVAAQMDAQARGLQQLRDDGGGRGLAVRACYAYGTAGAELEKDLHLARHDRAALFCGDEGGVYGQQARCAEDVVKAFEVVQITRAEAELGAARA